MEQAQEPIKRTHNKASIGALAAYCEATGQSPADVAEAFGYTRGAASGWEKANEIPMVLHVGLKHAMRNIHASRKMIIVGNRRPDVSDETVQMALAMVFSEFNSAF